MKTKTASMIMALLASGGGLAWAQSPLRPDGGVDNSPEASRPRNPPELSQPRNPPEVSAPLNPPTAPPGTPPKATTPLEPPSTPLSSTQPDTRPATPVADPVIPQNVPLTSAAAQVWAQVKDYPFADRARFLTTFSRFRTRVDQAISDIKSKKVLYTGEPSTWEAEMKRLDDARAYFDDALKMAGEATVANWGDSKDKLAVAWEKFETAYERAVEVAPR